MIPMTTISRYNSQINLLTEALEEYQKYNTIRNDLDAYLFALGEYALGESITDPDPKDYGIKESM